MREVLVSGSFLSVVPRASSQSVEGKKSRVSQQGAPASSCLHPAACQPYAITLPERPGCDWKVGSGPECLSLIASPLSGHILELPLTCALSRSHCTPVDAAHFFKK